MSTFFVIMVVTVVNMFELNAVKHPTSMLRRNLKCVFVAFLLHQMWIKYINCYLNNFNDDDLMENGF